MIVLDLKTGVLGVIAQCQFDTKSCIRKICSISQQSIDFFLTHVELIFSYTNYRGKRGGKSPLKYCSFLLAMSLIRVFYLRGKQCV